MSCYTYFNSTVLPALSGIPCGESSTFQTCCNTGDFCLSNNTCYTPVTKYGQGVMSGEIVDTNGWPYNYYVAGCTDPTYAAPECSSQCWGHVGLFSYCAGSSYRCGCPIEPSGVCQCITSDGPSFNMSAPSALTTIATISGSKAVLWTSSVASNSATAQQPSGVSGQSGTASDGGGVKIGVGVGISLGVVLLAFIGLSLWLYRRQRHSMRYEKSRDAGENVVWTNELHGTHNIELPTNQQAIEMPSGMR